MKHRLQTALSAAAAAAVMLVPGAGAGLQSEDYVPFVTDFPKPVPRSASPEPFVPFVTDFPKPAAAPVPAGASTSGIDWKDVGIGGAVGAALAALLTGSSLVLTRRARPARG